MVRRPLCAAAFLYAFLILSVTLFKNPFEGFVSSDTIRLEQGEKQVCTVCGTVCGKWLKRREDNCVLVVLLRDVLTENGESPGKNQRILCEIGFVGDGEEPVLPAGADVRIAGTLKPFQESVNPGAFNTAAYYRTLDVGYRLSDCVILSREGGQVLPECLYRIRRFGRLLFERYLSRETAAVVSAMVLGEKGLFDEELKDLYRDSGILHIAAISGLHLTFFGNGIFTLLKRSGVSDRAAAAAAAGLMVLYGNMAGFSPSAARAVIMFGLQMGARLLHRSYDGKTAAAFSALVLLALHPLYLFHPGFRYSFAAVSALLFLKVELPPVPEKEMLEKMAAVQLGLLPVSLSVSYTVPLAALILNLFVIPLAGVILAASLTMLFLALVCPPAAALPAYLLESVIRFYRVLCETALILPGHLITPGYPGRARLFLYPGFLAAGTVCAGRRRLRKLSLFIFSAGAALLMIHIPPALQIRMLDAGQGDMLYVRAGAHVYMIDGGSSSKSGLMEYDLAPALRYDGISKIDSWFISHSDTDHVSALISLLEEKAAGIRGTVGIGEIILPVSAEAECGTGTNTDRILSLASSCGIPVRFAGAGDSMRVRARPRDGGRDVRITCLSPAKGVSYESTNEGSMVLLLTYGSFSMLFTGDLEEGAENSFRAPPGFGKLSVLKVAHHGSSGSSGGRFLSEWKPETALISAGRGNPYGHPHREVIERLGNVSARIYLTSRDGAVTVRPNRYGYSVETFLKRNRF